MTTIHPAQRLLLSALTVTVSGAVIAYEKEPTSPSRLPLNLQELRQRRLEMDNSEVKPNTDFANPAEIVDFPTELI